MVKLIAERFRHPLEFAEDRHVKEPGPVGAHFASIVVLEAADPVKSLGTEKAMDRDRPTAGLCHHTVTTRQRAHALWGPVKINSAAVSIAPDNIEIAIGQNRTRVALQRLD